MGSVSQVYFRVREPDDNHPDGGYIPVSSLNPLPVTNTFGAGGPASGVSVAVTAAVVTSVNSLATVQTLLAADTSRLGAVIVNTDANDLYIKYGAGASLAGGGWTYKIGTGVTWEMPWNLIYTGIITGIWSADGSGLAEITDLGGGSAAGVSVAVAAAAVTSVNSLATVQTLLAANTARLGVVIVNTDANDLYIKYGAGASLASGGWTYKIGTGVTWEMPWSLIYTGIITGIWSVDGSGLAEITEL